MVNPDSPTFQFSEKVGLLIGKVIRYAIVGAAVVFIGGLINGPKPSHKVPNPPPPALGIL